MAFIGYVCGHVCEHVGRAAFKTGRALDTFGQEAGKRIGPAAVETWKHLDAFGQEAGKNIGNATRPAKDWVSKHPTETARIVGCIVAAPVAIAVAPLALGCVGFTAGGVAAGKSFSVCFSTMLFY